MNRIGDVSALKGFLRRKILACYCAFQGNRGLSFDNGCVGGGVREGLPPAKLKVGQENV
jgi:hypothetical protein